MSVKDVENLYDEIMNAEPVPKYKKAPPGRRSETSKTNAAKAREAKLAQLREKQMLENYVAQKTREILQTKKSMNPRDLLESYQREIPQSVLKHHGLAGGPLPEGIKHGLPQAAHKKNKMRYEDYDESEDSESDDEVIYVAPASRKPKEKKVNNDEIETLRKELQELKNRKNEESHIQPPAAEPKSESIPKTDPEGLKPGSTGGFPNPYKYIRTDSHIKSNDDIVDTMRRRLINF